MNEVGVAFIPSPQLNFVALKKLISKFFIAVLTSKSLHTCTHTPPPPPLFTLKFQSLFTWIHPEGLSSFNHV